MNAKISILNENEDDLKKTAPALSGINKENHFKTPEGYFETRPHLVLKRCQEKPQVTPWYSVFFTNYRKVLVSTTVIFAFTISTGIFLISHHSQSIQISRVDQSPLVQYDGILNYISENFDESMIKEIVLSEKPTKNTDSALLERDDLLTENIEFTKDDVINYLMSENTDLYNND